MNNPLSSDINKGIFVIILALSIGLILLFPSIANITDNGARNAYSNVYMPMTVTVSDSNWNKTNAFADTDKILNVFVNQEIKIDRPVNEISLYKIDLLANKLVNENSLLRIFDNDKNILLDNVYPFWGRINIVHLPVNCSSYQSKIFEDVTILRPIDFKPPSNVTMNNNIFVEYSTDYLVPFKYLDNDPVYRLVFPSIFSTTIKLPEKATIISNTTQICPNNEDFVRKAPLIPDTYLIDIVFKINQK